VVCTRLGFSTFSAARVCHARIFCRFWWWPSTSGDLPLLWLFLLQTRRRRRFFPPTAGSFFFFVLYGVLSIIWQLCSVRQLNPGHCFLAQVVWPTPRSSKGFYVDVEKLICWLGFFEATVYESLRVFIPSLLCVRLIWSLIFRPVCVAYS
jgi:hypothetical protein